MPWSIPEIRAFNQVALDNKKLLDLKDVLDQDEMQYVQEHKGLEEFMGAKSLIPFDSMYTSDKLMASAPISTSEIRLLFNKQIKLGQVVTDLLKFANKYLIVKLDAGFFTSCFSGQSEQISFFTQTANTCFLEKHITQTSDIEDLIEYFETTSSNDVITQIFRCRNKDMAFSRSSVSLRNVCVISFYLTKFNQISLGVST